MPKVKGLQLAVQQLQGHVDAVYDLTIAYTNTIDKETGARVTAHGMPGKPSICHVHTISLGFQNK